MEIAAITMVIAQSGNIQVVQRTAQELVIHQPPYSSFGVIFLVVGIMAFTSALSMMFMMKGRTPRVLRYIALVGPIPFLLFGLRSLTSERYIELSRATNTLELKKRQFLVSMSPTTIPLADVRRAIVVSRRRTTNLAVLLDSGAEINLTTPTGQEGCYAAEDAINSFLGVRR